MMEPSDEALEYVALQICTACIDGIGDECHTPGCALWIHHVDLPIDRGVLTSVAEIERAAITAYLSTPEAQAMRKDAAAFRELRSQLQAVGIDLVVKDAAIKAQEES